MVFYRCGVLGLLLLLQVISVAVGHTVNECGTVFSERYTLYSSHGTYTQGDIVRTGVRGSGTNPLKLWEAGASVSGTPGSVGASGWTEVTTQHASLVVTCNAANSLSSGSSVSYSTPDLAIVYNLRGRLDTIRGIRHTGAGGEIHILDGSASIVTTFGSGISIQNTSSTDSIRFIASPGTSITATSRRISAFTPTANAIYLYGIGDVFADLSGNVDAEAVALSAVGAAGVTVRIRGGVHHGKVGAVSARISDGGTGSIHVNVTGSRTALVGSGSGAAAGGGSVIRLLGRTGADTLNIGAGVIVCRGTYNVDGCSQLPNAAISISRDNLNSGSVAVTNAGMVYGGISAGRGGYQLSLTNEAQGSIRGYLFSNTRGVTSVINRGTLTLRGSWNVNTVGGVLRGTMGFGSGSNDSFTNSGTLIFEHEGTTLAVTELEAFTFLAGSTLTFSLGTNTIPGTALLDIGEAILALAGTVDIFTRDYSVLPTTGSITLLTGTNIDASTSLANIQLASWLNGSLSRSGTNIILSLRPVTRDCGTATGRHVVTPGYANTEVLCDHADNLRSHTNVVQLGDRLAIIYRGTRSDGSGAVRSISNTNANGSEIHILSGSVYLPEDGLSARTIAVHLSTSGLDPLRVVIAPGTSVTNADTTGTGSAVFAQGRGNIFMEIAGDTSSSKPRSGGAIRAYAQHASKRVYKHHGWHAQGISRPHCFWIRSV